MGTLETIMQLRNQGQSDSQITEGLKQQGLAPKEIDEALSQSKIKSELSEQDVMLQQSAQTPQTPQSSQPMQSAQPSQTTSELQKTTGSAQMQPSMMQQAPENPQQPQPPQIQQPTQFTQPMSENPLKPSTTPMMPSPESAQYPEYQYPEYQGQQIGDIETINEIAEQILDEKTSQLKNQIIPLIRFKEEVTLEVEKLNERLLKIENTLNEIQMAVLGKIGDYGKDIQNIAKEMHSTQDSFSKILNPLTDNLREMQKIAGEPSKPKPSKSEPKPSKSEPKPSKSEPKPSRPKPKTRAKKSKSRKRKSKKKPSFEDYLR